MSSALSAPKVVLLAVHLAAEGDILSLSALASAHAGTLRKELLLRILLTYLPDTCEPREYVPLLRTIAGNGSEGHGWGQEELNGGGTTVVDADASVDLSAVDGLGDEDAAQRVRKLHLLPLAWPGAPEPKARKREGNTAEENEGDFDDDDDDESLDPLTLFLLHRAYRIDEGEGSLGRVAGLVAPFLDNASIPSQDSTYLRTWMVSVLLPLLRRNFEYYPHQPVPLTLHVFEALPDSVAVAHLLAQTGGREEDLPVVGRDLRGLIGPWLYNDARWKGVVRDPHGSGHGHEVTDDEVSRGHPACPGWEQVLDWLTTQAAKSWRVAVKVIDQWDGPGDIDTGGYGDMWLDETEQEYLEKRYARAAIASAYLIPEPSIEALTGAHTMATKIMALLDQEPSSSLPVAASLLSPVPDLSGEDILGAKNVANMRTGLLLETNPLTAPTTLSTQLTHALILSAYLLTRSGCPCTVRRAGELVFLQSEREQKEEATRLINSLLTKGSKSDDKYWVRVRNEVLWLRDWGAEEIAEKALPAQCNGVFGQLKREFLEVELLKAILTSKRYSLARSIYEDTFQPPLARKDLQDTVISCAINAYDNASNPNRTRGGVLNCDDMVHAFPKTIEPALVQAQRIEALLKATHSLGEYRLVLKQGEPFTPVILRVHPDPVSIISKVLEQNPKSYTRIQDLLDVGMNMVLAGITVRDSKSSGHSLAALAPEDEPAELSLAEHRVTAMCIQAALAEDDFETAYSYVVNRLAALAVPAAEAQSQPASRAVSLTPQASFSAAEGDTPPAALTSGGGLARAHRAQPIADDFSWRAALAAGRYRRTARTLRPTHIGTAASDPEVRHLEQRLECLAAALRVAPAPNLPEILSAFRRAEEELNAALRAEHDRIAAWGDRLAGQQREAMPGAFESLAAGGGGSGGGRRVGSGGGPGQGAAAGPGKRSRRGAASDDADAAPMSLFDLSRATALIAQRNLGAGRADAHGIEGDQDPDKPRARKRDQFRDAAMGTLVSGVGWLINATPSAQQRDDER